MSHRPSPGSEYQQIFDFEQQVPPVIAATDITIDRPAEPALELVLVPDEQRATQQSPVEQEASLPEPETPRVEVPNPRTRAYYLLTALNLIIKYNGKVGLLNKSAQDRSGFDKEYTPKKFNEIHRLVEIGADDRRRGAYQFLALAAGIITLKNVPQFNRSPIPGSVLEDFEIMSEKYSGDANRSGREGFRGVLKELIDDPPYELKRPVRRKPSADSRH
jgi:hypothetical protein